VLGFDLRPLAPADASWKRGGLVYVIVLLVAVGAELVAFLGSQRTSLFGPAWDSASGLVDLVLTFALLGFLGFGVAAIPRFLPGAEAMTIDATGVHLEYRTALREDFLWSEPSGFLLLDGSALPDVLVAGRAFSLRGPQLWRRRTLLTRSAFEAILAAAGGRGAVVSQERAGAWGGPAPIRYRVRPREISGPR
jgi:hypothetical protein